MSDWFERLLGFSERSPEQVRQQVELDGTQIRSRANRESYECGQLEILSLNELRGRVAGGEKSATKLHLSELVGDARALHTDPANAGALFQVASQFNLLEMVSPSVTPEHGIAIYEHDPTQGPACAIACGAGTIYRNYFVELDGQIGQTASKQVDCLAEIGKALLIKLAPHKDLEDRSVPLWAMKNGYALPSPAGLKAVDAVLEEMSDAELDAFRAKLKIGVQWDTQVTLEGRSHLVTQAYCSALPVAYSGLSSSLWERFARLVLEAAYEATLAAAILNASKTGNKSVYLTLLGGGAFGNERMWILDAIRRACGLYLHSGLNVKIVSFRSSNSAVRKLVDAVDRELQKTSTDDRASGKRAAANHHCPGCGVAQKMFLRYPWYFCQECLNLAEDGAGRRLEFGNMSLSGGLYWKYADAVEVDECGSVLCLILGRAVVVTEARFGGVVAQPMNSQSMSLADNYQVVDLRTVEG